LAVRAIGMTCDSAGTQRVLQSVAASLSQAVGDECRVENNIRSKQIWQQGQGTMSLDLLGQTWASVLLQHHRACPARFGPHTHRIALGEHNYSSMNMTAPAMAVQHVMMPCTSCTVTGVFSHRCACVDSGQSRLDLILFLPICV